MFQKPCRLFPLYTAFRQNTIIREAVSRHFSFLVFQDYPLIPVTLHRNIAADFKSPLFHPFPCRIVYSTLFPLLVVNEYALILRAFPAICVVLHFLSPYSLAKRLSSSLKSRNRLLERAELYKTYNIFASNGEMTADIINCLLFFKQLIDY